LASQSGCSSMPCSPQRSYGKNSRGTRSSPDPERRAASSLGGSSAGFLQAGSFRSSWLSTPTGHCDPAFSSLDGNGPGGLRSLHVTTGHLPPHQPRRRARSSQPAGTPIQSVDAGLVVRHEVDRTDRRVAFRWRWTSCVQRFLRPRARATRDDAHHARWGVAKRSGLTCSSGSGPDETALKPPRARRGLSLDPGYGARGR
jgi:hypothetical protein